MPRLHGQVAPVLVQEIAPQPGDAALAEVQDSRRPVGHAGTGGAGRPVASRPPCWRQPFRPGTNTVHRRVAGAFQLGGRHLGLQAVAPQPYTQTDGCRLRRQQIGQAAAERHLEHAVVARAGQVRLLMVLGQPHIQHHQVGPRVLQVPQGGHGQDFTGHSSGPFVAGGASLMSVGGAASRDADMWVRCYSLRHPARREPRQTPRKLRFYPSSSRASRDRPGPTPG